MVSSDGRRQRCSGPAYNWRLSHWDSHSETFLLQGSVWSRPTIPFLRDSFQKRTFLMPTLSWQQEYYMAPLWSWVPCLVSWAQLPARTRFSLPPLSPEAYVLQGWQSLTCGGHNLSLEAGLQVFHPDFFPGLPSLKQVQDHLVDDIAPKVTERDKSC